MSETTDDEAAAKRLLERIAADIRQFERETYLALTCLFVKRSYDRPDEFIIDVFGDPCKPVEEAPHE